MVSLHEEMDEKLNDSQNAQFILARIGCIEYSYRTEERTLEQSHSVTVPFAGAGVQVDL